MLRFTVLENREVCCFEIAQNLAVLAANGNVDEDHIGRLHAGLQAEARAADRDESRPAPRAVGSAAEDDPMARLPPDHKSRLQHPWNDGDPLSVGQECGRDRSRRNGRSKT